MKRTLYLDTSVISAYFDDRDLARLQYTRDFWSKLDYYKIYISTLVRLELEQTQDDDLKRRMVDLVKSFEIIKPGDKEELLASKYLEAGITPERFADDMRHVAAASAGNIDFLVSWNFKHLVNVKTRRLVNLVNIQNGYEPIELVAPPEI